MNGGLEGFGFLDGGDEGAVGGDDWDIGIGPSGEPGEPSPFDVPGELGGPAYQDEAIWEDALALGRELGLDFGKTMALAKMASWGNVGAIDMFTFLNQYPIAANLNIDALGFISKLSPDERGMIFMQQQPVPIEDFAEWLSSPEGGSWLRALTPEDRESMTTHASRPMYYEGKPTDLKPVWNYDIPYGPYYVRAKTLPPSQLGGWRPTAGRPWPEQPAEFAGAQYPKWYEQPRQDQWLTQLPKYTKEQETKFYKDYPTVYPAYLEAPAQERVEAGGFLPWTKTKPKWMAFLEEKGEYEMAQRATGRRIPYWAIPR